MDSKSSRVDIVPSQFARTVAETFGAPGSRWLQELPALLQACEQRWRLTLLPPFTPLSYNYVAPAVRGDGSAVVVKLGVPNKELATEVAALQHYDGRGSVRLLDADAEQGMLLLERLMPGDMLLSVEDDEEAITIAATVMKRLWRPLPSEHIFPTLETWAAGLQRLRERFDGGSGPLPSKLVTLAEGLFEALFVSSEEPVLLHGDLHHFNILRAERHPWLAIDPKGVAGEPGYEVGPLLRNALPPQLSHNDLRRLLAHRVDQLAEHLQIERERLVAWGVAHTVLSAWWSIEDHGHGWEPTIACGEALAAQL